MNRTPSVSIPPWVKRVICWVFSPKGGLIILLGVLFVAFVAVMVSQAAEGVIGQLLGLAGTEGIKNQILTFLGLSMGGILLALQAVIANRRAEAMENAANAQAKANENTEKGQRQERLKNAIEHLGHDSVSIRLGGAYELFHLAQDTKELRQTVLDILCSHIRRTTSENEYRDKHRSKPSEEIQSLLTMLFVQEDKHDTFQGLHINLQGSWLNGAKLSGARLGKAVLDEVHLRRAYLDRADLQKAQLCETHLQGAHLMYADMRQTVFLRAHLQKAELRSAELTASNISEANLHAADLWKTNMRGACLDKARLHGANLIGAHLQASRLSEASLYGANLLGTGLHGANLQQAKFQGASFGGAVKTQLQGANLRHVQLQGVKNEHWRHRFKENINESIGNAANLSGMIFAGGLRSEDLNSLVEDLPDDRATTLREKLSADVGREVSHELPERSGAIIGSYTTEEAEQWIAEYEEAMSEVSEEGDS